MEPMMKVLWHLVRFLVPIILAVPAVFMVLLLVWQNRGSQQVLTAAMAPLTLACGYYLSRWFLPRYEKWVIAGLAALVAVIGVLAFAPAVHYKRVLNATFVMQRGDNRPVPLAQVRPSVPVTVVLADAPREVWSTDKSGGGIRVYHHLLQRAILEALRLPALAWDASVEHYRTSTGPGYTFPINNGTPLPLEQIKREFAKNRFIGAPFDKFAHRPGAAPPDTVITGTVPDEDGGHHVGLIRLQNPFYELKIETRYLEGSLILRGRYALLTGGQDEDPRYASVDYMVRVTGTGASRFRYHPEMQKYISWIETVIDGLARYFDEEERFRPFIQDQTFRHIVKGGPR
jgi:hypothetical protein